MFSLFDLVTGSGPARGLPANNAGKSGDVRNGNKEHNKNPAGNPYGNAQHRPCPGILQNGKVT
jgi:hypothetical protein